MKVSSVLSATVLICMSSAFAHTPTEPDFALFDHPLFTRRGPVSPPASKPADVRDTLPKGRVSALRQMFDNVQAPHDDETGCASLKSPLSEERATQTSRVGGFLQASISSIQASISSVKNCFYDEGTEEAGVDTAPTSKNVKAASSENLGEQESFLTRSSRVICETADWLLETIWGTPRAKPPASPLTLADVKTMDSRKIPAAMAKVLRDGIDNQAPGVMDALWARDEEIHQKFFRKDIPLRLPEARKKAEILREYGRQWDGLSRALPRESRARARVKAQHSQKPWG